jgi:hypothetical protein
LPSGLSWWKHHISKIPVLFKVSSPMPIFLCAHSTFFASILLAFKFESVQSNATEPQFILPLSNSLSTSQFCRVEPLSLPLISLRHFSDTQPSLSSPTSTSLFLQHPNTRHAEEMSAAASRKNSDGQHHKNQSLLFINETHHHLLLQ